MNSADSGFQIGVAERVYAAAVRFIGMFMVLNSDSDADGEVTLRDNRNRDCQHTQKFDRKRPP
ncbi:MAG: hypothetical protein PHV82_17570 [Victivallaceae bacterium]|nr:hypothetical protein [Victivallaceae bacterium]